VLAARKTDGWEEPRMKLSKIAIACGLLVAIGCLASCYPVGSEGWCRNMREKSKGDWTPNEAADFARHCIL
jgi:hypothetical protein